MREDTAILLADWATADPLPAGTRYTDLEIYCDGDRVLYSDGTDISHIQIAEGTDEIVIWGNGEPVWVKASGQVALDRTQNAPLTLEVA